MSGFSKDERLQMERRLRQATQALEATAQTLTPLAEGLERLEHRVDRFGRLENSLIARLLMLEAAKEQWEKLHGSVWARLRWVCLGRF